MDISYEKDGGDELVFNIDNVLDSNNFALESSEERASSNNSLSDVPTVFPNVSNKFSQVECSVNKPICSALDNDKQIELSNNNVSDDTNKPDTNLNHLTTQDPPLLNVLRDHVVKESLDVYVDHQIGFEQSSLSKDKSPEKKVSLCRSEEAKDAITSESSSQKLVEIPKSADMPNVSTEHCSLDEPVLKEDDLKGCSSEEINTDKDCSSGENNEHQNEFIKENLTSESCENSQSLNTIFSPEDECLSGEEEVYLEVDEIIGSDEDVLEGEDEEKQHIEESQQRVDNECEKAIDSMIEIVENETSENKAANEETEVFLSLKTSETPENYDDPMSEEEVYEEIEESSDEETAKNTWKDVDNFDAGELPDAPAIQLSLSILNEVTEDSIEIDQQELCSDMPEIKPNVEVNVKGEPEEDKSVPFDEVNVELEENNLVVEECKIDNKIEINGAKNVEDKENEQIIENKTNAQSEKKLDDHSIPLLPEGSNICDKRDEKMDQSSEREKTKVDKIDNLCLEVVRTEEAEEAMNEDENTNQKFEIFEKSSSDMAVVEKVDTPVNIIEESNVGKEADSSTEETVPDTTKTMSIDSISERDALVVGNSDAKVELSQKKTVAVLSDDELDSVVEEFVVTECSSNAAPSKVVSDSEDELELLIEDFKAVNSDDDCLIVEDTCKEIVIKDDTEEKTNVKNVKSIIFETSSIVVDSSAGSEKKSSTTEGEKLDSSTSDANIKLKGVVGESKEVSSASEKQTSRASEKKISVTSDVAVNSSLIERDAVQTGNTLSINCGLFSKTSNGSLIVCDNVKESFETSVNDVIINLLTTVSSGSLDDNAKVNSTCDQGKEKSEFPNDAFGVKGVLLNFNEELGNFKVSTSSECGKSVQSRKGDTQKAETSEIVIDLIDEPSEPAPNIASSPPDLSLKESRKRSFAEMEDKNSDVMAKKLKETLSNGVPADLDLQEEVKKKVSELIPQKSSFKFITTKKILDKIAMDIVSKSFNDIKPSNYNLLKQQVDEAEEMSRILDEDLHLFNVQVTDILAAQDVLFKREKFNPKECDLQNLSPAHKSKGQPPRTPDRVKKLQPSVPPIKPQPLRPNNPSSVSRPLAPAQQPSPVRRMLAPTIVTNASRPRQAISGQRFPSVSPNVTIAGNPLASVMTTNTVSTTPFAPRPSTTPARFQTPNSNSTIDLTGESAKRTLSSSITPIPTTTTAGKQNVLVPISNLLQMLPNTQLTTGNQLQVTRQPIMQPARPGMLPPNLRQNLGSRTVAYFMPSNTNQLPNFPRGGIPILSGSNSRSLQTIVVRMTTAAGPPPLSTIVNSSSRMQAPAQTILNTSTVATATARGLVVFPRAAKHPAPYPQSPVYPVNPKLKLLPPKPSLKGSRAPQQGIILSWNMNLQSSHADISNYQLFAYQENSGLVTSALWKKVGDVKALPLPMACTLTQFIEGNRYYFCVRAVDVHNRCGPYSDPVNIMYSKQDNSTASNK